MSHEQQQPVLVKLVAVSDKTAPPSPRWADLVPDKGVIVALEHAGARPGPGSGREPRKTWSEKFANACAVLMADKFRQTSLGKSKGKGSDESKRKRILPKSLAEGTEPLTPLGSESSKRIDVTIADPVLGLEIGVSLKGLNFKDDTHKNFDKNATGRLYELSDEVRLVHEHLPHCFMAGIFFMPLESTADKRSSASASSFAAVVHKLKERTGRLDAALLGQAARCDASYVALYSVGEDGSQRGATRFFDTSKAPPMRGRPRITDTLTVDEVVAEIVAKATYSAKVQYGEAEEDP
jgi:hypothetical protein